MDYSDAGLSRTSKSMSIAALVFAILSILCSLVIYLAVPLGAFAILLALLSRGDGKMATRSMVALILAACTMAGSCLITGYAFYAVNSDPALKQQVDEIVDYYMDFYELSDPSAEQPVLTDPYKNEQLSPVQGDEESPAETLPEGGSAA